MLVLLNDSKTWNWRFRSRSNFRLGHYSIRIRPLGVKTGQYRQPNGNVRRTEAQAGTWQRSRT